MQAMQPPLCLLNAGPVKSAWMHPSWAPSVHFHVQTHPSGLDVEETGHEALFSILASDSLDQTSCAGVYARKRSADEIDVLEASRLAIERAQMEGSQIGVFARVVSTGNSTPHCLHFAFLQQLIRSPCRMYVACIHGRPA